MGTGMDREQEKAANRRAMPTVAGWVDQLREHFPTCRVVWATEGGHRVGQVPTSGGDDVRP
jgi:hypothetical protein